MTRTRNVHFRQSQKGFASERQTQAYAKANRNLPYRVFQITKEVFIDKVQKIHASFQGKKSS